MSDLFLLTAAREQDFSKEQIGAELGGDILMHIRASIDSQNAAEVVRLRNRERIELLGAEHRPSFQIRYSENPPATKS